MPSPPKKLGKAKIDLEYELWFAEGRTDKFHFNRRLVDTRPDVKAVKAKYTKYITRNTPSMKRPVKREEHFKVKEDYERELRECLKRVFEEMLTESFTYPILLRRDKDYDHKIDWRYCLYQGYIYQFDHSGYSDEEMIRQIQAAFPPKES